MSKKKVVITIITVLLICVTIVSIFTIFWVKNNKKNDKKSQNYSYSYNQLQQLVIKFDHLVNEIDNINHLDIELLKRKQKFINEYQPLLEELQLTFTLVTESDHVKIDNLLKKFTPIVDDCAEHLQSLKEYSVVKKTVIQQSKHNSSENGDYSMNWPSYALCLFGQLKSVYKMYSFHNRRKIIFGSTASKNRYAIKKRNVYIFTLLFIIGDLCCLTNKLRILIYPIFILTLLEMHYVDRYDIEISDPKKPSQTSNNSDYLKKIFEVKDKYPDFYLNKELQEKYNAYLRTKK